MAATKLPQADFVFESGLTARGGVLAGMDEVGRGALAGPVCVGVTVVLDRSVPVPVGLTDSKLLTPRRRAALAQELRAWVDAWAVGTATAREIDAVGIIGALRLAGERALEKVSATIDDVELVLLDGSHDWLTGRARDSGELDLFGSASGARSPKVVTKVKADVSCASVAAASVLAKCHRDAIMAELDAHYPGYGWLRNKGYGSADHREAIGQLGPTGLHRRSWRLN
ncbi:hypothetical protein GCM10010401_01650 [Rarobacter faecitabidus]|uniref:Ribonuclease n=1 Tax=Rarobacter faecitabidus TaxID=13243 RepID=A0A542ZWX2_RARFA|nr:ribonuclease HII [Rarobacter faecitabidus]TQL64700.1 RNase HII [Rarobacter faecitabidus]